MVYLFVNQSSECEVLLCVCSSDQELSLGDAPVHMTLLDERPSGKLCVSYSKQTVVDAIDEIMGTAQRVPNLDIAKVRAGEMV